MPFGEFSIALPNFGAIAPAATAIAVDVINERLFISPITLIF
jgi:hypothetical protein